VRLAAGMTRSGGNAMKAALTIFVLLAFLAGAVWVGHYGWESAGDVTMPAWRQAITVSNRLYKVGSAIPDDANASLSFPGGVRPYGRGHDQYGHGDGYDSER